MFPKWIENLKDEIVLEAFSTSIQQELWQSIQTDREHPKRKTIWPAIKNFETLKMYINSCDSDCPSSEFYDQDYGYVIREKLGRIVGTFHIFSVDWAQETAEVGYGVHHSYGGNGFATKALSNMERILLEMGIKCVTISCQTWNQKSWAIPERSGYHLEKVVHKDRTCEGCDDCTKIYVKNLLIDHFV